MNMKYIKTYIEFGTPEYDESVRLRDLVLRKPLGLEFNPEDLALEYDSIVARLSAMGTTIAAPTDLEMYKLTSSGFDDPHAGGITGLILGNGPTPTLSNWLYSASGTDHCAEFLISSFSGGGGGLYTPNASAGGSGDTPSTTPSQGSNGESGAFSPVASAGGGGGAGEAGGTDGQGSRSLMVEVCERVSMPTPELAPDDLTIWRAALPLLGDDPFGETFFAKYGEWQERGLPYNGLPPIT